MTRHGEELARLVLESVQIVAEITDDILIDAISFRMKYKKRNISMTDAIDYIYSQKNKMLVLTGDDQFKDLPGVEFVQETFK